MIIKILTTRTGITFLSDSLKSTNSVRRCQYGKCIQFRSNKMYAFIKLSTDLLKNI